MCAIWQEVLSLVILFQLTTHAKLKCGRQLQLRKQPRATNTTLYDKLVGQLCGKDDNSMEIYYLA